MNFSHKGIQNRKHQLESAATHRLHKLQLIGIRLTLIGLIFVGLFAGSFLIGMYTSILSSTPDVNSIQIIPKGYTTTIVDSEGNPIQSLVGKDANREYVTLDKIPENLQNAFIAIEDERFRKHNGVDTQGVLRALTIGIKNKGDFTQGASTITQQLLKNQVFEGGEENTLFEKIKRKLQEQFLALQTEKKYSKNQILEYYLNTINLGQNTLGVQAASKRYFNKNVSDLTLSECAVLAGITQNPSAYNPISHPAKNSQKRTTVLTYMKNQGYISSKEYTDTLRDPVYDRIQKVNKQTFSSSSITSYFTDALIEQVIQDLKAKCGYTETQAYNALYSRGLTIYSTQDKSMQKTVDSMMNNKKYYPANSRYELTYQLIVTHKDGTQVTYSFSDMKKWFKSRRKKVISGLYKKKSTARKQIKQFRAAMLTKNDTVQSETIDLVIEPQSSFVVIDQHTGAVKALVGGRGDKNASRTLNRATDSVRQPGSTFKILSTYLPALDTAGMTLATVQDDALYYYPGTKRKVKNWYGNSYRGLTSLREAMAQSMNVIAVKTLNDVSPKIGYDYLLNLGFTSLVDSYTDSTGKVFTDIALPMALGGLTKGVTNLELTSAFASIANGGVYNKPSLYTKVLDHDGNVLIDNSNPESHTVIKDTTAALLTNAMQDVVTKRTATDAQLNNMPASGKSGTTSDNRDFWFEGFTPYYTCGIWMGYDGNQEMSEGSWNYHFKIWAKIMNRIDEALGLTYKDFAMPGSLVQKSVCTISGKLAGSGCPSQTEWFDPDTVPTETCSGHASKSTTTNSTKNSNDKSDSNSTTDGNSSGNSTGTNGDTTGGTGGDSGNTGGGTDSGNNSGNSGNTGGDSGNTGGDSGNTGGGTDSGNTGGSDSGNGQ